MFLDPLTDSLIIPHVHINFTIGHGNNKIPFIIPNYVALIAFIIFAPDGLKPVLYVLLISISEGAGLPEIPPHLEFNLRLVMS